LSHLEILSCLDLLELHNDVSRPLVSARSVSETLRTNAAPFRFESR
jgi:hypothetical protein